MVDDELLGNLKKRISISDTPEQTSDNKLYKNKKKNNKSAKNNADISCLACIYCIAAKVAIHFWGFIIIMPILLIASTLVSIINFWPIGKNTDRFSKTLLIYGCIHYLYPSNHIAAKLFLSI